MLLEHAPLLAFTLHDPLAPSLPSPVPHLVSNILASLVKIVGSAVAASVKNLGTVLANSTKVDTAGRFASLMRLSAVISAWIGSFVLLVAAAEAGLTRNVAKLGGTVARVGVAIVAGFILIGLVPLAQSAIAVLTGAVASSFGHSATALGATMVTDFAIVAGATGFFGPIVIIMLAILALLAIIAVWAILVMASAFVYLSMFFLPMALAFSLKMGKKLGELMATALLVPFVITGILAVGFSIIGSGSNIGGVLSTFVSGTGLVAVACFSPFAVLKMFQSGAAHIANAKAPHQTAAQHAQTGGGAAQQVGKSASAGKASSAPGAAGIGAGGTAGGAGGAAANTSVAKAATTAATGAAGGPIGMAIAAAVAGAAQHRKNLAKGAKTVAESGNDSGGGGGETTPTPTDAPTLTDAPGAGGGDVGGGGDTGGSGGGSGSGGGDTGGGGDGVATVPTGGGDTSSAGEPVTVPTGGGDSTASANEAPSQTASSQAPSNAPSQAQPAAETPATSQPVGKIDEPRRVISQDGGKTFRDAITDEPVTVHAGEHATVPSQSPGGEQ